MTGRPTSTTSSRRAPRSSRPASAAIRARASMNCLKQDFDDVFKVFVDVLRNPAFAQDKLDLAKVQANAAIARRNDNVGGITGREIAPPGLRRRLAARRARGVRDDRRDHARRPGRRGTRSTTTRTTSCSASSATSTPKAMRKTIEKAFASWPKGPAFTDGEGRLPQRPRTRASSSSRSPTSRRPTSRWPTWASSRRTPTTSPRR